MLVAPFVIKHCFLMEIVLVTVHCLQSIRIRISRLVSKMIKLLCEEPFSFSGCLMSNSCNMTGFGALLSDFWWLKQCEMCVQIVHMKNWTPIAFEGHFCLLHWFQSLKVNYEGILVYEILMDCVARKGMQKTTSNYLKWFPRYCDLNFYKLSH